MISYPHGNNAQQLTFYRTLAVRVLNIALKVFYRHKSIGGKGEGFRSDEVLSRGKGNLIIGRIAFNRSSRWIDIANLYPNILKCAEIYGADTRHTAIAKGYGGLLCHALGFTPVLIVIGTSSNGCCTKYHGI